ncbi:hypothetical protein [Nocardia brasiliensis]|uniref:hypothetical protein n=1 Tax=Nocardia brasiliensis TaxID=37326 RepID=UPI0024583E1C|nr:hypothetical protein [Nocardia brasiliensis]
MAKFLTHRREPFELDFLSFLVIVGIGQLITGVRPGSIAALLPPAINLLWLWMMTVGSAVALLGIVVKNPVNGVYAESWGLLTSGMALLVYGAAQATFGGASAVLAAAMTIGLVTAWVFRLAELRLVIKELRGQL